MEVRETKRRPGHLTRYARHAGISLSSAAEQLRRVGIDYGNQFDFKEADKRRLAARHADRLAYSKPIYVEPGEDPRGADDSEGMESDDSEGTENEEPKSPAFAHYQAQEKRFKAELAKLDFEERIGNLVNRETVEAEAFRLARLVRDAVLNVPSRIAGIVAAETDQRKVHNLLEQELRQALEALADAEKGAVL